MTGSECKPLTIACQLAKGLANTPLTQLIRVTMPLTRKGSSIKGRPIPVTATGSRKRPTRNKMERWRPIWAKQRLGVMCVDFLNHRIISSYRHGRQTE